ncbi:MAG: hypothetical protein WC881_03155 [Elusimicrobiota bacterium]|jgi:hypothetical protein
MKTCLLAALLFWPALAPAQSPDKELIARAQSFRSLMRELDSARTPAARNAALQKAPAVYDQRIPYDFRKGLGYASVPTWSLMTDWTKLASQETMFMGKTARRYAADCGSGLAPAQATLAAARRFQDFLNSSPWPQALQEMIRAVQTAHAAAIKDWERLARCAAKNQ